MKSGFVSLIGRPNVGKSTLLNGIIGKKIAITSNKPQTTRNVIQGIYNSPDSQIIFVDTPGIHKPNHKLGSYLNKQAYYSAEDVDIILFLVDGKEGLGGGDKYILERLKDINTPIILVLNKIDGMKKEDILKRIIEYKDLYDFKEIVPVSALKENNTDKLLEVIKSYLTDDIRYYGEEEITNKPLSFLVSEIVREKIFHLTNEEVPHSITCITEKMKKTKNGYDIIVCIIVDRDALKKIIIGSNGSMIKKIGVLARKEIEELLDEHIFLETYVKTIPKWRDREKYLAEFGFEEF